MDSSSITLRNIESGFNNIKTVYLNLVWSASQLPPQKNTSQNNHSFSLRAFMDMPLERIPKTFADDATEKLLSKNASKYCDVTIVSNDGVKIPALRILLSLRCSYFERLFACHFKDSHSLEISIAIPADIFRNVLQYIYTDTCDIMECLNRKVSEISEYVDHQAAMACEMAHTTRCRPICHREDVLLLIQLMRAGDFVGLKPLVNATYNMGMALTQWFPYTACTIFEACWGQRRIFYEPPLPKLVKLFATDPVTTMLGWESPYDVAAIYDCSYKEGFAFPAVELEDFFQTGFGVAELSFDSLQLLLPMLQGQPNNEYYFEALAYWVSLSEFEKSEGEYKGMEKQVLPHKGGLSRLEQGRLLAKLFHFDTMRAEFIIGCVDPSGLVQTDDLSRIYREQLHRKLLPEREDHE